MRTPTRPDRLLARLLIAWAFLLLLFALLCWGLAAVPAGAQTRGNAAMIDDWRTGTAQALDTELGGIATSLAGKEPLDSDLTCIAALATTGFVNRTGAGTCAAAGLVATDIPSLDWSKITSGKPTTLAGYGITDAQGLDCDLTSLAGASSVAIYYRSAACTWGPVTIGSGVAFSGGTLSATGSGGTVTSVGLSSTDFTVSGSPVTGSGTITANMNTQAGITAGSYGDASHSLAATVNAKGVLTALSSNSIAIGWSQIASGKPTTLSGYGITDAQPLDSDLTAVAALTTTTYGRGLLTAASAAALMNSLSATDLTTGTLPDARLSNVITAGSSGDASHTTALTFDAHGRLTAATSTAIAIANTAVSGLGTLSTQSGTFSGTSSGTNTGDQTFSLTVPSWFTAGASSTSALSFTANTESANTVLAGPATGSAAAPTFRSLVFADLPSLSGIYQAVSTSLTSFAALSWISGSQVPALTSANTWSLKPVGSASGNILDKASGDSLYLGIAAPAADSSKLGGTSAASYLLSSTAAATYQPLTTNLTNFNAVAWSSGVQVPLLTGASTWTRATIGTATGNILDKASGDALYLGLTATAADSSKLGGAAAASYAPLATPTFTGTPAVPTAALLTNTNQAASTAFVQTALGGYLTTTTAASTYQATSAKDTSGGYPGLTTGTWTPAVTFATPGTSSIAYTTQTGHYTKIGDLVFLDFMLVFTPTLGTASGNFMITGIPYSVADTTTATGAVRSTNASWVWPTGKTQIVLNAPTTTALGLTGMQSAAGSSAFAASALTSGSAHNLTGTIVYKTP